MTLEAGRGIGVYMENTVSNKIENCIIRNLGVVGVCIGKGSKPSAIYRHPDEKHPFYPKKSYPEGSVVSMNACTKTRHSTAKEEKIMASSIVSLKIPDVEG